MYQGSFALCLSAFALLRPTPNLCSLFYRAVASLVTAIIGIIANFLMGYFLDSDVRIFSLSFAS